MARSPEYQLFLDIVSERKPDTLSKIIEYPATEQEVGWWKQHQVRRAIRKCGNGSATPVDYHLVRRKTSIIPSLATRKRLKQRSL
ncbi:hypothetical protein ACFL0Y_00090 [Patescibacteria group bacterium]